MFSKKHKKALINGINEFKDKHVLVLGDVILDHYVYGETSRISPEAPVPVVDVTHEDYRCGGAANVVHNLVTLGAETIVCGMIGNDFNGKKLLNLFDEIRVSVKGIYESKERKTTAKTRIIANNQQITRVDREKRSPLSKKEADFFISFVADNLDSIDVAVFSDYNKGMFSGPFTHKLINIIRTESKKYIPIIVDPKPENFNLYKGVDLITPNHHEAKAIFNVCFGHKPLVDGAEIKIRDHLGVKAVLVTRGREGMTLFEDGNIQIHIPTIAKKVFDVTGAGDTVVAVMALSTASGLKLSDGAMLANFAAGLVIAEMGAASVSACDLKCAVENACE
jgi:D-beta-D-heptose 7-phosphate kinase/D-beta-D-heptose 1-phosphate adenosyltransferase